MSKAMKFILFGAEEEPAPGSPEWVSGRGLIVHDPSSAVMLAA
jgi:hypothetical protein